MHRLRNISELRKAAHGVKRESVVFRADGARQPAIARDGRAGPSIPHHGPVQTADRAAGHRQSDRVVPFFIHFTQGFSAEQRARTIRVSAFSAFCVIAVSALAGIRIIEFFGISLASFQVGGGMLLLISSLQMLNAQPAEGARTTSPRATARSMPATASPWCR